MTFFYPGHFSGLGENLDQGEHQGDLKSWPEDNPSFARSEEHTSELQSPR